MLDEGLEHRVSLVRRDAANTAHITGRRFAAVLLDPFDQTVLVGIGLGQGRLHAAIRSTGSRAAYAHPAPRLPATPLTQNTSEIHELGLFTDEETLQSIAATGLDARHEAASIADRGLYGARIAG
jgi:hypothetical protein